MSQLSARVCSDVSHVGRRCMGEQAGLPVQHLFYYFPFTCCKTVNNTESVTSFSTPIGVEEYTYLS